MLNNYFLEDLSWPVIRDYLKESDAILIPFGATEEHAEHLPVSMDTRIAVDLCKRVSAEAKCLVAPTISLGYSEWFMEFPGTLTLSYDLLLKLLQEYCDCLVSHGFRKLIFVSPHGLNATAIGVVGRTLRSKGVLVSMINPWKILNEMASGYPSLVENKVRHAGEIMTSVALAICPELVDMTSAAGEYVSSDMSPEIDPLNSVGGASFKGHNVDIFVRAHEVTASGSMGFPTHANAETGEAMMQELAVYVIKFIKEMKGIDLG